MNEIVEYDLTTGQPRRIGHFAIEKELGSGAMGSVYRAKDESLGNLVAIKVIKPDLAQDKSARERFLREARAAATLRDHDHIVAVFSVNEIKLPDGRYLLYLVMPLLKGETLQDRIERAGGKPLPLKEQLLIARQITEGLAAAHGAGLVHRDIKPGNIWLEARTDGTMRVKLLDFGLARSATDSHITATGATLGTPMYMAPEQGSSSGVDHRADLWSLGVVVFQMATGRYPFEGETPIEVMINARMNPLPSLLKLNPLLSKPHVQLIEQLLQKKPADRLQSATDVMTSLQAVRQSYVKDRTEPSTPILPPEPMDRERKMTVLAVAAALLFGAVFVTWFLTRPRTKPTELAESNPTTEETKIEKKVVEPTKVEATKEEKKVVPPVTKVDPKVIPKVEPKVVPKVVVEVPELLICPADEEETKRVQKAWADYLKLPVVASEDLGDGIKLKLVLIPPGKFRMGSPAGEPGRVVDEMAHEVTITKPYYIGMYEVSRGEFRKFLEADAYETEAERNEAGSSYWDTTEKKFISDRTLSWRNAGHAQTDQHPVVQLTWNDAQAYCKWLSQRKGVRPGRKVGLPTEAEWEFACRAGTGTRFFFGDSADMLPDHANTGREDDYEFTAPTGRFLANVFGLYDMHGNVWEWCDDWYEPFKGLAVKDPNLQVKPTDGERTLRGGSWNNIPIDARSAIRTKNTPDCRSNLLGFRVCIRLDRD